MKHNDIENVEHKLTTQNLENIFNVATDGGGHYFYNLLRTVNFPADLSPNSFSYYTVITNDTWPLIAWKYYYDVKLWWIICAVNQITNPLIHPGPGDKLKILNPVAVRSVLNTINQQ